MAKVSGLLSIVCAICVSPGAPGATWYVDGAVAQSGDGKTWETALEKIQEGIDKATEGDTVIVAEGTYVENIRFKGSNIILRSTDPVDSDVVEKTVIDGSQTASVVRFSGGENQTCVLSGFTIQNGSTNDKSGGGICGGPAGIHTLATIHHNDITGNWGRDGGGLASCDGTIRANVISSNAAGDDGGGLWRCDGTVRNNTITANSARYGGGGLYGCDAVIQDNTISGNSAGIWGGGLFLCCGTIENNTITGNSGRWGGGLHSCNARIEGNTISGNTAELEGGGLAFCNRAIQNNVIMGNSAGGDGGGLYRCSDAVRNNIITRNWASRDGGGLYRCSGTTENNIISGNSAQWCGGGLGYCYGTVQKNIITGNWARHYGGGLWRCDATVQDNTICGNLAHAGGGLYGCDGTILNNRVSGNRADYEGGGLVGCGGTIGNNTICGNSAICGGGLFSCDGTIRNCIIWGNAASRGVQLWDCSEPTYSCIGGWTEGGPGNITDDPRLLDPDGPDHDPQTDEDNDYHLAADSPCIDAGRNEDWTCDAVDLDGNPRIYAGASSWRVDMGAYEYVFRTSSFMAFICRAPYRVQVIWTSRPGETYTVWSCLNLSIGPWIDEATMPSQGAATSWTDGEPYGRAKFYRVEMTQ